VAAGTGLEPAILGFICPAYLGVCEQTGDLEEEEKKNRDGLDGRLC
jgi:hypothetical protein